MAPRLPGRPSTHHRGREGAGASVFHFSRNRGSFILASSLHLFISSHISACLCCILFAVFHSVTRTNTDTRQWDTNKQAWNEVFFSSSFFFTRVSLKCWYMQCNFIPIVLQHVHLISPRSPVICSLWLLLQRLTLSHNHVTQVIRASCWGGVDPLGSLREISHSNLVTWKALLQN